MSQDRITTVTFLTNQTLQLLYLITVPILICLQPDCSQNQRTTHC